MSKNLCTKMVQLYTVRVPRPKQNTPEAGRSTRLPPIYQKSTQRKVYIVPIFIKLEIASVYRAKVVRPGGFELPTFWFVGKQSKILSAASGVAYRGTRLLSRS